MGLGITRSESVLYARVCSQFTQNLTGFLIVAQFSAQTFNQDSFFGTQPQVYIPRGLLARYDDIQLAFRDVLARVVRTFLFCIRLYVRKREAVYKI
jgi:hypothetical protein